MWWIIVIAVILILFIIGLVSQYRHYLIDRANKSKIYHSLQFEKGTSLEDVKEKLGTTYDVVSKSGVLLRIRYKLSIDDIKNYKRRKYKKSKFIQMDFDRNNNLIKSSVI